MNNDLTAAVKRAIRSVHAPWANAPLAETACEVVVAGSRATITIEVPAGAGAEAETVRQEAERAAAAVDGVASARAVLTAHAPAADRRGGGHAPLPTGRGAPKGPITLPGVKKLVAVASGKGGVGKSTVAANLAVGLANRGRSVGFLDADVYGPSAPVMFRLGGRAEVADGKIVPHEAFGLKIMSIGLMVDQEKALVWRGLMVMGAVQQMLADTDWGDLDVLVIDTPPGTGDAHLTLAQKAPISGVVVVTTPQEMALADARRGAAMFRRLDVPVIGVVENMAYFVAPDGSRSAPFGEGGGARLAETIGAPLLSSLPLDARRGASGDGGRPFLADAEGPSNDATREAFAALLDAVERTL